MKIKMYDLKNLKGDLTGGFSRGYCRPPFGPGLRRGNLDWEQSVGFMVP